MQESQEAHVSGHLEEIVAAVSVTPRRKPQSRLPQTALFQPPREKLHLCEEKATRYASSHEYKQAVHELTRCVALTRICYGDSHWKLAEAHINLAQGYLQLKGLSLQAKQHAEKARDILVHAIVPPYNDDTDVFRCSVELFHTLGRASLSLQQVCQGQKKSKEALPHYQEALECVQTSKGDKSRECVPVLRELAGAEQALGSHDTAIDHLSQRATAVLRESLEAKVGAFGDFSPEVAETYRLLGGADLAQGNHSGAHRKLKKCLQIQTLLYGPQDKRTLATQQTLDVLAKAPEVAVKLKQAPKAKCH
ncbi:Tetratricopeptide repeat protein 23 [Tupaia chinensis]|uniref:Tetratricopeptide repeat protein 23 n=1 Tax=Tupaia chinensis TaxID=246437 RepID=L8YI00_TUPCH|nr:Tetratricopeptide repeat protein 23 [Tupaia chinensis]